MSRCGYSQYSSKLSKAIKADLSALHATNEAIKDDTNSLRNTLPILKTDVDAIRNAQTQQEDVQQHDMIMQ
jgi:hypothetical protein